MTDPRPPLDLDAIPDLAKIRDRVERALAEIDALSAGRRRWTMRIPAEPMRDSDLLLAQSVADARNLCIVVEELLAEVTAVRADNAVMAEALDAAVKAAESYRAELDAARAERTEPATGEDVEVVAGVIRHYRSKPADDLAERILAALDLPGRERALREEIEALRNARLLSVIFSHHKDAPRPFALHRKSDRSLIALGAEFPDGAVALRTPNHGWTTRSEGGAEAFLAGDDGEIVWLSEDLGTLAEMEQERDEAEAELRAEVELADANAAYIERLTAERDAANAALADVAQKLDEARTERNEARARISQMLWLVNQHPGCETECSLLDEMRAEAASIRLTEAARRHAGGEGGGT